MVCDDVLDEGQRSSSSLEAAGTQRLWQPEGELAH